MSIEARVDEPLKLMYVDTEGNVDGNRRRVNFIVQNVSAKDVTSYEISYSKSRAGVKGAVFVETNSLKQIFLPGASRAFVVDCDAAEALSLSIDSVEFANGSHWKWNSRF